MDPSRGWTRPWPGSARRRAPPALVFVDAPLVVTNERGQRECETQVGRRYGRWKVSANTTNVHTPRLAGVRLRGMLEARGWRYSDGIDGPPERGRAMSECYPYTTLVGAFELGYTSERPRYKRKPPKLTVAQWRPERATNCDRLISRIARLATADPPLLLDSHPVTRRLADEPSPLADVAYKHREDLIDALLCMDRGTVVTPRARTLCQVPRTDRRRRRRPAGDDHRAAAPRGR